MIMISRKIVFVLSVACLFFVLNACLSKSGSSSQQTQATTEVNSKTGLDREGTYSGIIPCADCTGIETKISLKGNNAYQISWKYLEKDDEVYVNEGTFVWNPTDSIITLGNMDADKYPTMYKVGENYLLQLDLNGDVITGEMADKYILRKD
jgi:uncharacterized lipoprotein NlpE involved in copper resistance